MAQNAPNLTRRFSRDSLKKACYSRSGAASEMSTVEEDLAVARAKLKLPERQMRFSFYKENGSMSTPSMNSIPDTRILHTMSSLTEDLPPPSQAAQHTASRNDSPSPAMRHSMSYNNVPRAGTPVPTDGRQGPPPTKFNMSKQRMTRPRISAPVQTDSRAIGMAASFSSGSSGTNEFGHRPKFTRPAFKTKLGSKRFANNPIAKSLRAEKASRSQPEKPKRKQSKRSKKKVSISSAVQMFRSIFKLLHLVLLFPEWIADYFMASRRWTVAGRSILITGASSGIGAEMARQYSLQGAKIALIARTEDNLERIAKECRELGADQVKFYTADLANHTSTELAMRLAIKDFSKFDIVVLNAGKCQGCFFEEINDPKQIDEMIRVNFNGAVKCLHYLLPHVPKSKNSRIVMISNTAGIVAAPYQSIYSGTKHALTGFSNSLRIELNTTYGKKAPKVCLVSFPEISGTRLNNGRMDMGAKLPPAKWYSWAGKPLSHAVHELLPAIAAGKRDFGQPSKFNVWRSLYSLTPGLVDQWIMDNVQRTHYRPLEETVKQKSSDTKRPSKIGPNKSWTN